MLNRKVFSCVLLATYTLWAQSPQLEQRQPAPTRPAPPEPMKVAQNQETAHPPNSNSVYQALRSRITNGGGFTVQNVVLKRDAGTITLSSGTVFLFGPVSGRVTGAVFLGEGILHVDPPVPAERAQLKAVMRTEVLDQRFTSAVFNFTDDTAAELRKQAPAAGSGQAEGQAEEVRSLFRNDLKYNLEARLLQDVMQPGGGFFMVEAKGPLFSKRLIFTVDPRGALGAEPDQVSLVTASKDGFDVPLGFPAESSRIPGTPAAPPDFSIRQQTLDASIEKGGRLTVTAVTAVTANRQGVQVLPLRLFPFLRVSGVWQASGEALDFIQEEQTKDAAFAVILKKPLAAGESVAITTTYSGKDAVVDEGNGNYYLVAREDWFPNASRWSGNYSFYHMTFRTAKDLQVVATGNQILDHEVDGKRISVWQSPVPLAVAGFNLGSFKQNVSERNKSVQVVSYANRELPDRFHALSNSGALGTMSTTGMLQRATSEGDAAIQLYTEFFGPLPYDHVYLTQQTACNYGQSWPMLVYLPICYFWDSTIQHELGVLDRDPSYWQVVTAHEVAHQWWGQTVGFASYRDQWMSEGFAHFSAGLFLLNTRPNNKEERDFWNLLHKRLLEKNANGLRPVDVGPLTMGYRVNSSRTGFDVYQALVYDKGAMVLHSLESLYFSKQTGEATFIAAMHDLVSTYCNRAATTEDFKAVMERHMPADIDIDGNHRLDWFFDAYVYGTAVPRYTLTSEFTRQGDEFTAHFKLSQSEVPANFRMAVPVYIELENGRIFLLGRAKMIGDTTVERTVKLGKVPSPVKQLLINYNFDLLSE
jgi:hypothetical protein